MKKNFLNGFLAGLCGAIFLFLVAGATYLYVMDVPEKETIPPKDVSAAEQDGDPYEEIV